MKTRGKGKTDVPATNYAKDTLDSRDFGDDGDDTNGYPDDRGDDVVQARSESRTARNPGSRRGSRIQRPVTTRGKSDKNLMESAEFQDVVKGFFDFIEEIKRKKKKEPKNGPKPLKTSEEPERGGKRVKLDIQGQAQQAGKSELQSDDTSDLYSFNKDKTLDKNLLDIKRNKDPTNIFPPPLQPQDQPDLRPKDNKQKEPLNKPGYTGANYLPSANLPGLNTQPKQQANKPLQSLYFDNPALFPDRLQLQGFPEQNLLRNFYMSPYDNYPYGVNSNQLLNYQLLEALLQKNQPELLASLLESAQGGNAFYDLQREAQRFGAPQLGGIGNQRFGNQNFARLMDNNGPEPINPKGFEGKLGRAATHVAIAYFIYFKSLDPDTIAKADKTKMDPTYNARMLKEKRTETYPADIPAMMNKLGPFYSGLPMENSYPPNIDYLERRLMEGQRFLRDPGINPALAGYQGKPEKLEEEKSEPKRRTAEAREAARQASNKKPPKEEDIINIDEGSDVEEKPQQAAPKPEAKVQKAQAPAPGPVSAEDIVQEIAELTGHSDVDKKKNARKPPSKSASEENQKPSAQKTFTVEEGEQPVGHASVAKGTQAKEAPKNIEVILSSDDEVPKKDEAPQKDEVAKKEETQEKEPKIEEKIEEKMEEEINEIKEEEQDKKENESEKEKEKEQEQEKEKEVAPAPAPEQSTEAKPVEVENDEKAAPASSE